MRDEEDYGIWMKTEPSNASMGGNLWDWIKGWVETLVIRLRYPDLYRALCDHEFDEDDYTEVHEP